MGQTHIFCLLTFFGTPKNCRTAAVVQGYCSSGTAMKRLEGFENRIPGTAVAIAAQLGAVLPLA